VNQEPNPAPPSEAEIIATPDASADLLANNFGDYVRIVGRRLRSGESGALPVIAGLVVIVIIFQVKNSLFLSAGNLVNLMAQSAFIITLGMAEVFVLLLGDIDLAAGYTAACGAVVALWMLALGDPLWASVLVALAASAAYGALQGIVIAKLKLPSFVVTLAGQLGLSGLLLYLINATGSIGVGGVINLHNSIINDIESGYLSPTATWIVMIAIAVLAGLVIFYGDFRRRSAGLVAPPVSVTLLKIAGVLIAAVVIAAIANQNRSHLIVLEGLPWGVLVVPLRDRRQRRGGTAGRHQHRAGPHARVHAVRPDRGRHRHHLRLLPGVNFQRRGRRAERALRHRGGGHRRHQPLRRARQDAARGARRSRRRRHLQRPRTARPLARGPADVDGAGLARGRHRRPDHQGRLGALSPTG
jgi:hypothetical protein